MAVLRGSTGTVGPIKEKVYTAAAIQVTGNTATVALEGSLDGTNWVQVASSTYAAGDHNVYSTAIVFGQLRANVSAAGTTATVVNLIGA